MILWFYLFYHQPNLEQNFCLLYLKKANNKNIQHEIAKQATVDIIISFQLNKVDTH